MKTTIEFSNDEKLQANMCVNIDRLERILNEVWDYAVENNNDELLDIIEDFLNMKEV